jgi:hypothetical protein
MGTQGLYHTERGRYTYDQCLAVTDLLAQIDQVTGRVFDEIGVVREAVTDFDHDGGS